MSHPALVVCDDCGGVLRGDVYEDGSIVPIGVAGCPDCGGTEWTELVDSGGWGEDEE